MCLCSYSFVCMCSCCLRCCVCWGVVFLFVCVGVLSRLLVLIGSLGAFVLLVSGRFFVVDVCGCCC